MAKISVTDFHLAFSYILTDRFKKYYFQYITGCKLTFREMVIIIKKEFKMKYKREHISTEWNYTTLVKWAKENPKLTLIESFEVMRDRLIKIQPILCRK